MSLKIITAQAAFMVGTTVLLPEFQYALLYWSSPALTRFDTGNTSSVSNIQLSVIKTQLVLLIVFHLSH